jgi:hypothetical protein
MPIAGRDIAKLFELNADFCSIDDLHACLNHINK